MKRTLTYFFSFGLRNGLFTEKRGTFIKIKKNCKNVAEQKRQIPDQGR